MKFLITAFLALITTAVAFAEPELRGTPAELTEYLKNVPKTVTVTAEAEVKVQADRAIVSLSVRTEDKRLETALRNNRELRGRIIGMLEKQGFKADHIKASQFSQTPKYGLFGDKAKSYIVENVVKVTVHNEKEFQAAAGIVDSVNEVRYLGVEYEQNNKDAGKAQALEKACDKALEKKKLLERKIHLKLVTQKMSEGGGIRPATVAKRAYSGSYGMVSGKVNASEAPAMAGGLADDSNSDGESGFGEMVFTAEVTLECRAENSE